MKSNVKTIARMPLALSTAMLLACVWAASPALAEEAQKSQTVKFQDLDVNTREGVQTLYRRIHAAAWHVCLTTSTDPDRKSTRLNSSHVRISYAVFCLKKKKK